MTTTASVASTVPAADVPVEHADAHDLDAMFRRADAGSIPVGRGTGTAIAPRGPGRRWLPVFVRWTAWQGKQFVTTATGHELVNLVTPFGLRAVRAQVYEGASLVDGRPCVVLDYARTSWIARWVRDEIRAVGPRRYLGVVFVRGHRVPLMFTLDFPSDSGGA
jgi:hypothetical protein